jgi:hypothetical protein
MPTVRFARLLALVLALTGCSANCLRDSDCDDTQVCVRDSCVRPSLAEDASASGAAGQAGGQGLINPSYPGLGGAAGMGGTGGMGGVGGSAMTPEQGGAAGTNTSQGGGAGTAAASGGSATLPRENLDASVAADADADAS